MVVLLMAKKARRKTMDLLRVRVRSARRTMMLTKLPAKARNASRIRAVRPHARVRSARKPKEMTRRKVGPMMVLEQLLLVPKKLEVNSQLLLVGKKLALNSQLLLVTKKLALNSLLALKEKLGVNSLLKLRPRKNLRARVRSAESSGRRNRRPLLRLSSKLLSSNPWNKKKRKLQLAVR